MTKKEMFKIKEKLVLAILLLLPIYLIKIKVGWMSFNALELLIAILFFFWALDKEKKYQMLATRYQMPIVLIISGLAISVLANRNYYSGFGAIKGWFIFPILFGAIFFDQLKKDGSLPRKAFFVLFFSGAAISVIGIAYKILRIVTFDNRLEIFWDSPNQLAMFLAAPFLIGIYFTFLRLSLGKTLRLGLGIGLAVIAVNLYLTQSFGAWLGIAAASAVMFWLGYGKLLKKKYLIIFPIILAVIFSWAALVKLKNLENLGGRSSLASREMIWRSAGLMIEKNSLFGIGPGNFQNKYLEYQKYFTPYLEWSAPQPHGVFFAFWLESGLAGFAGFIMLLFYFFRDNKIAIRNDRDLGTLLLAIMTYALIHGLVDTTYWRNDLALVFWLVIAANLYLVELPAKK